MSGKVPPSSRARKRALTLREIERVTGYRGAAAAGRRFERFTGHDPGPVAEVEFPDLDGCAVAVIGPCDGVLYTTVRDGKTERYIHEFAAKDRPLLAVTPDGKQLLLIGGRYRFTERGIVDKSDPG